MSDAEEVEAVDEDDDDGDALIQAELTVDDMVSAAKLRLDQFQAIVAFVSVFIPVEGEVSEVEMGAKTEPVEVDRLVQRAHRAALVAACEAITAYSIKFRVSCEEPPE